jgi:hypothetical protein
MHPTLETKKEVGHNSFTHTRHVCGRS